MDSEDKKIRNFRDLDIWQLGKDIVREIYCVTKEFPREELYALASQMQRAAVSIPSNIAEGFNRYHNKEYRQFLFLALGSCAELETQIEICTDLSYVSHSIKSVLLEKVDHESRMIRNLIKKL